MKTAKIFDFFGEKGFKIRSEVKFTGDTFTVVVSSLSKLNGKKSKTILRGEGVARRSNTQEYDLEIGKSLALNRSLDALHKKFTRKSKAVHSILEG